MDLHIKVPVAPEFLSDILETALYGGIDYWCANVKVHKTKISADTRLVTGIEVLPDEDAAEYLHVTYQSMVEAIQKLCENRVQVNDQIRQAIYAAVTENDAGQIDATAADVIVQVAAFDEIVYG